MKTTNNLNDKIFVQPFKSYHKNIQNLGSPLSRNQRLRDIVKRICLVAVTPLAYPILGLSYLIGTKICRSAKIIDPTESSTTSKTSSVIHSDSSETIDPTESSSTSKTSSVIQPEKSGLSSKIHLKRGDITKLEVDAIVNAANETLLGGGGIDGAIHRAGGREILNECRLIPQVRRGVRCPTGKARITTAGKMPAKHVIHTVGPRWHGGKNSEEKLIADAYRNSLELAVEHKLRTIAFPSISTGIFGFPIERAAQIALKTINEFLEEHDELDSVEFILFSDNDLNTYQDAADQLATGIEE